MMDAPDDLFKDDPAAVAANESTEVCIGYKVLTGITSGHSNVCIDFTKPANTTIAELYSTLAVAND